MKNDASHRRLRDVDELGHEARITAGDHAALKLWLRLLSCTTQVEDLIRRRLRAAYGVSLARFDYLAQLHRHDGLKMRELSRYLMVTGGSVTGLTDELEREGLVRRESSETDRRAWIVRMTPQGRRAFEAMARQHEGWILELFGGMDAGEIERLYAGLGSLRLSVTANKADSARAMPRDHRKAMS